MENKQKSIHFYMRALHRDLGFLTIGLVLVYALSGIVLVYRDTDFLKKETIVTRSLDPHLTPEDLGMALKLKTFKVEKVENGVILFNGGGSYNEISGDVSYVSKDVVFPFNKLISLHKTASQKSYVHWFSVLLGIVLLFLAVSSFWMFKRGTQFFRRGLLLAGIGVLISICVLFLI